MLGLIQGAAGHSYESSIVLITPAPGAFSDVGPDTIGRANYLLSYRRLGEIIPAVDNRPHLVREPFTQLVND